MSQNLKVKEAQSCPNCGASHFVSIPDSKYERCGFCGTQFLRDEPEPTAPPESISEPAPIDLLSLGPWVGIGCMAIVLIIAFIAVSIWFGNWAKNDQADYNRRAPRINTIGQYLLPNVDCADGKIIGEYGFEGTPPVIKFTISGGKGIWKISKSDLAIIEDRRPKEQDYLWLHCDTPDKKPDLFVRRTQNVGTDPKVLHLRILLPVDGQEVIMREQ